jgi:hypothetical protein
VCFLALVIIITMPLAAQHLDELPPDQSLLLRNVSGTATNPGYNPRLISAGAWTAFLAGSAHVTFVSESGPEEPRNEFFSTNWLGAGAQRTIGSRGQLLLRGRVSLEQVTIPDDDGYPQILQWISAENGGPQLDRMRPHDFVTEAAAHFSYRTFGDSHLHLYAAAVGDPAFGAPPFAVRASSMEFAEAPFAFDIQETVSTSTRVVTLGWASRYLNLEASAFHDSVEETIEDGEIDSNAARLTLTPTRNLSVQISRAELGKDTKREATSGSISYGTANLSATALYTRREVDLEEALTSFGFEITFRARRNTFMGRVETVDRPAGYLENPLSERTTHMAVGYIFDFLANRGYRAGAGFNFDYHTQTHDLEHRYGHKPQAIYTFVRFRTE